MPSSPASPFRAPSAPASERRHEWLALQGKTPAHLSAWVRGEMPAELARRAAAPGDDRMLVAGGGLLGVGVCGAVVAWILATGTAWIVAGVLLAIGLTVASASRLTNPASRMGYGRVAQFASRGRVGSVEDRGADDEPRRFETIRWRLPSGVELESVLATAIVDSVRLAEGGTFDLFVVEKRGKPVLLAVLPPGG